MTPEVEANVQEILLHQTAIQWAGPFGNVLKAARDLALYQIAQAAVVQDTTFSLYEQSLPSPRLVQQIDSAGSLALDLLPSSGS